MEEKTFIQQLYSDKTKNDDNSKSLANLLNILTKTVFGDANRFVFELLQNADDSPSLEGVADIEVELKLLDNYLIFSHTGKHFSKEDVKGISNVGSGDSGKTKDIEKTGYKGIGFKSIFTTCDLVYILSNKFTFKFDKNHEVWKDSQEYPWQIIPIWFEEDELINEVRYEINSAKVTTVIFIDNKEKIKKEIIEVFSDSRIMLFLRHVKGITFFDGSTKKIQINREKDSEGFRNIYLNGALQSRWIYQEYIIPIPKKLKESIKHLDQTTYPDKLKEAAITKITFAASVLNGEIQEIKDDLLYCYLPTKVQHNFNFLINGDFITNAERTQILENVWNEFIFNQVAICKIKWLAELVGQGEFKYQFTKLIRNKFTEIGSSLIKKSFNDGLDTAIAEIPFIPKQNKSEFLLKISECILDSTGFCDEFGTEIITNHYYNNYEVADCKILDQNKLATLGAKKVNVKDLCEIFLTDSFKRICLSNFQFNIELVQFLYKKDVNSQSFEWSKQLKTALFLLDNTHKLNSPESLYFPLTEGDRGITNVIDFKCIDINLFDYFKSNEELLMWLTSLGVREPSEIDIIRKSIFKMINADLINQGNALEVGKFVFKVYKKGVLEDNDYKILSNLKLLIDKGTLELPKKCYLPDYYKPELSIEKIFPKGNYVSCSYAEEDEILQCRKMLLRLGVKENISIKIEANIERLTLVRKYPSIQPYLSFIDNGNFYDSITRSYISSGQHGLRNFVYVEYLEYTHSHKFSLSFWKLILENHWSKIYSNCTKAIYYTRLRDTPLISYFKYYIQNNPSIPGDDGQCYKSTDLYSRSLKKIVGDYFPVVHNDIGFNKEQEEFLGIKTIITIQDCFSILKKIEGIEVNSHTLKQIDSIYKQLISNKPINNKEQAIGSLKLLSTDDSFQSVSSLYFFDVEGQLPPTNSKYFIKVSESLKDKEILFAFFEIPIIKKEDLQLSIKDAVSDQELISKLHEKAKYLATLIANIKAEDPLETLYMITKKITNTKFLKAQSLSLVLVNGAGREIYDQNVDSWYHADKNSVYYAGSLNSPLTIYNLSYSLSSFLEIEGKDREVALILQLSNEETEIWLNSKGYDVIQIEPYEIAMFSNDEIINSLDDENRDIEPEEERETFTDVDIEDDIVLSESDNNETQIDLKSWTTNNRERTTKIASIFNKECDAEVEFLGNDEIPISLLKTSNTTAQSNQKKRLLSYVSSEPSNDSKQGIEKEIQLQCQLKAIQIAVNYEEKAGRRPTDISDMEETYDIISCNRETEDIERYIKICGFYGEWSNYDVAFLSTAQMKMAKENAEKFWIYVVEFVEDEQNKRIHRIQNPFNKITKYAFDYGWRDIAEKDNPLDKFVIGIKIKHNIHGSGFIKGEINKGKSKLLIVDFESGEKRVPINLTQMMILED